MPSHSVHFENRFSMSPASNRLDDFDSEHTTLDEVELGAYELLPTTKSTSLSKTGTCRSQEANLQLCERPPFGIEKSEQPITVEVAMANNENNFTAKSAIYTTLDHSYVSAAAAISLGLQRIPMPASLKAMPYYSPFGLLEPTHFVAMLIRGSEFSRFTANIAVLDMAPEWQNISIFLSTGFRGKANAAGKACGQHHRSVDRTQAISRGIQFDASGEDPATIYLDVGQHEGAPLDQSLPSLYSVGPSDTGRLYPPGAALGPSRSVSRVETADSPDTPVDARISSPPTSFELDELSRCSREAQVYGRLGRTSQYGHGAPHDKMQPKDDIDSAKLYAAK
ncbi:hypothetical protein CSIM01_10831 [Colletotrichum simmondsii]|uniref:Uncharacterized protein n=1 Tax=Colletotrichum simmondsii TaxID=703756 RepID=A0A135RMQ1_9PEZI|nr:hypothetical protein CSIM01_10831 [Colletotrichum simmondsii]